MFKSSAKTKEPQNADKAYDYAVFLLSLQLRTEGEIREKMKKRGYSAAIIEQTITRLLEQKYLNDQRYAEVYLDNLKKYKTFGFYGVKKKLIEKRLPSEIIEKVLADGLSVEEEIKIAKRLFKKEGAEAKESPGDGDSNQYQVYDEESGKTKHKLAQKLKARGFRGGVITKMIF